MPVVSLAAGHAQAIDPQAKRAVTGGQLTASHHAEAQPHGLSPVCAQVHGVLRPVSRQARLMIHRYPSRLTLWQDFNDDLVARCDLSALPEGQAW